MTDARRPLAVVRWRHRSRESRACVRMTPNSFCAFAGMQCFVTAALVHLVVIAEGAFVVGALPES